MCVEFIAPQKNKSLRLFPSFSSDLLLYVFSSRACLRLQPEIPEILSLVTWVSTQRRRQLEQAAVQLLSWL